ncbi:MAG: RDD family protein [Firmicutes bacterium]|nr:RDD family protein [Bacillota bacterium]
MVPKADLVSRFLAALIDGLIAGVLMLVPLVGFIAGGVYTLTKDGIVYELTRNPEYKSRTIGKKLLRLTVERNDGGEIDLATSAKRNLPLAIGSLIGIVPILGWVIGPLVAPILTVIEIVLVVVDASGRRLGDRWAGTQVVPERLALPPSN